ncbi:hypothetical protein N9955_00930 [bacterium]|nr:hypothetical protein [bacterium]
MKPQLTLSCSVTKSHLKEFLFLKFTAELYHKCIWFLSCDEYCFNILKDINNCSCELAEMEDGKVFGSKEEISNFYNVIQGKFSAARRAITEMGSVLMVDSDIVFCGCVDELLSRTTPHDAQLSPHFQWNSSMDDAWGLYNVGFVLVRSLDLLDEWEMITKSGEYEFEQVPIQKTQETGKYSCLVIPVNHNMGWWRFNNQQSKFRVNSFGFNNKQLLFDGHKVTSFHFHSFVECQHSKPFKEMVFEHLIPNMEFGQEMIEQYNILKETNYG